MCSFTESYMLSDNRLQVYVACHLIAATIGSIQELVFFIYKILLFAIGSQLTVWCCLVKDMSDWVSVLMHVTIYSDNAIRRVDRWSLNVYEQTMCL